MRSAEPPTASGSTGASASIACCEALRVATVSAFSFALASSACGGGLPAARAARRRCGGGTRARASGKAFVVRGELRVPLGFERGAARAPVPGGAHGVGNLERRVLPAQGLARGRDFLVAERRAVDGVGARLVGRALPDHGLRADDRGLARSRRAPRRSPPRRRAGRGRRRSGSRSSRRPRSASACCRETSPPPCRRWRFRCRRRWQSASPSPNVPASEHASWEMPSIRQPSPTKT